MGASELTAARHHAARRKWIRELVALRERGGKVEPGEASEWLAGLLFPSSA